MYFKELMFALFVFLSSLALGQSKFQIESMSEDNTLGDIVESMMGDGVVLRSFTSNQPLSSKAVGSFYDEKKILGLEKGIVLSTGSVDQIVGDNNMEGMTATQDGMVVQNNPTHYINQSFFSNVVDDDLAKTINTNRIFDATSIELEIIPQGNTIEFSYVFGSEEYDEFVGSPYNDGFAFYISEKGAQEKENLAVIPRTNTPVSINNVNGGNPSGVAPSNQSFYVRNSETYHMQYDGFTKLLTVTAKVEPGKTYILKMVIADVGDYALDSGVFIEHKSIKSYNYNYEVNFQKNSSSVDLEEKNTLDSLIERYWDNTDYKVLVSGHADSDGNQKHNEFLAKKRAKTVAKYLLDEGIPEEDIYIKGYGDFKPVGDNNYDLGKSKNRRVEAMLIPRLDDYWDEEKSKQEEYQEFFELEESNISQNYPNPCKTDTKIPLFTNHAFAVVKVITLDGKLVQELIVPNPGYQEISFNTAPLPLGAYYLTLVEEGEIIGTKKMVKVN
ncbi:MAG: hypothetical protein CMP61_12575 [Flavobacteriales bacterium]|nr:hypothetical protein [Flavobacteriales bacterium]|tara:strand:- start:13016 stop:14512 length:1497 start_codon:yes stop_codon:yes gene_type:complete